ncbi:MAG: Tim44/TimA family putative adaptor protein [Alphaproteobacteria bacterium]
MQFIDLIFLLVTLGIGFILYLRLGRRTGNERRFFYPASENVVDVTPTRAEATLAILGPSFPGLQDLQKHDRKFSVEDFIEKIKDAFEQIIQAFVKGDKDSLSVFLKDKLMATYTKELDALGQKKITTHLEFFRLVSAEVKDIRTSPDVAHIDVHFVSEQTQIRKNEAGKVIAGDAGFIDRISELWTFERPLKSKGPWMLSGIMPYEGI